MSGVLKRKYSEVEEEDPCYSSPSSSTSSSSPSSSASSEWESDEESRNSDNQDFNSASPTSHLPIRSILKSPKLSHDNSGHSNSVVFNQVTVFLFQRCQGFTSVPRRGGATLGMVRKHSALRRYTLAEHTQERRRRRRERLRDRLREERLETLRQRLTASGITDQEELDRLTIDQIDQVPDEDIEAHLPAADLEDGEEDGGDGGLLYPYASRQRQALLRAAGARHIDREEKRELHALRKSREDCGCDCQGFCEPETCACSLNGIKCQMDRSNFPCGCTKDGCGNTNGRVEFNSRRVQTHYIHTVMRLELERRLQDEILTQRRDPEENEDDLQELQDQGQHQQDSAQEGRCPFGFTLEEEGLPLSIPTTPTFHFSSELCEVENSCCSDMTDSSGVSAQSEDSDVGGSPREHQPLLDVDDGGVACVLSFCDSDNEDCSMGSESGTKPGRQPSPHLRQCVTGCDTSYDLCKDTTATLGLSNAPGSHTDNTQRYTEKTHRHTDNTQRYTEKTHRHTDNSYGGGSFMAEYQDDNANQATALFTHSPLQDYPNTPSPSIDYSSSSYMDLSLSSDSDLELFDNFPTDYSSAPLHNSFKGHKHPDNFLHLQVLSSANVPQFNETAGICLLESLIGLSDPIETPSSTDNQLLEQVIQ
ncbi:cysteine/serine-rich nuclear protein 1-like isoform X2 [Oncorhynchus keta]|uniref:cysteine/serine-rich nuclear protein 1-like isoform X2 n=1 Tax=Oncorhynchus keta TaxID=8018 RepID=UPI00227CC35A|nr:cysteine/serine-rich nuclear protein 1-like isoform X2 [Oncorhynchus keta]